MKRETFETYQAVDEVISLPEAERHQKSLKHGDHDEYDIVKPISRKEITVAPSLETMSFVLRHPEVWPAGFGPWDYRYAKTCAMELACRLWPSASTSNRAFGISESAYLDIFVRACVRPVRFLGLTLWHRRLQVHQVTPVMVADTIDACLARR